MHPVRIGRLKEGDKGGSPKKMGSGKKLTRIGSQESLENAKEGARTKKAFRFRRGAVLCSVLLALLLAFLLFSWPSSSPPSPSPSLLSSSLPSPSLPLSSPSDQTGQSLPAATAAHPSEEAEELRRLAANQRAPVAEVAVSPWERARLNLIEGGKGVLQAVGLRSVVSWEERKKVSESLKESGDDDHEEALEPAKGGRLRRGRTGAEGAGREGESSSDSADSARRMAAAVAADPGLLERIPLANFAALDGELSLSDGSCKSSKGENLDCYPHGACSRGTCTCSITYTGSECTTAVRPFALHLRAAYEGRFVLSVEYVRRMRGLKYLVPGGTKGKERRVAFEAPFVKAGKANRRVWSSLQTGKLLEMEPVLSQALLDLLPGQGPLSNAFFTTCAVVGNSGFNMLFPSAHNIDHHSAVFRIYDAPTRAVLDPLNPAAAAGVEGQGPRDFSAQVGVRTTFRMIDDSLVGWQKSRSEIQMVSVSTKEGFFGYFQELNKQPDSKAYLLNPDFYNYVADNSQATPSPLTVAIFLALQKCARVDVYGTHWLPGYGVPELYYGPESGADQESEYTVRREVKLIEGLAKAGVVSLAHPCAAGCEAETGIPCKTCPPGSECPCGKYSPLPVAYKGYCHIPGNYTCFYMCRFKWRSMCKGGPGRSECPEGMDTSAGCMKPHKFKKSPKQPFWATPGSMREFDKEYAQKRRVARQSMKEQRRRERGAFGGRGKRGS